MRLRPHILFYASFWLVAGPTMAGSVPSPWTPAPEAYVVGADTADSHLSAARALFKRGRFADALVESGRADKLYEESEDRRGRSQALLVRGTAYVALGDFSKAIALLDEVLAIGKGIGDIATSQAAMIALGDAYQLAGRTAESRHLLETVARTAAQPRTMAAALNGLATLYASQGALNEAISSYRASLELAREAGDAVLSAKATTNLARALKAAGREQAFVATLNRARTQAHHLDLSHDRAYVLISIGRMLGEADGPGKIGVEHGSRQALETFDEAANTAKAIGDDRALSYALGYAGALLEQRHGFQEALQPTRQAVFWAQLIDSPELLYRWQWQTGRLLRALDRPEQAIQAYRRAEFAFRRIRQGFTAGGSGPRESFRAEAGALYLELADLLIRQADQAGTSEAVQAYLRRARATVERLKGVELEDYFRDDCVATLQSKTAGIDRLAPRTAAIYPVIFSDRLALLVSLPDGLRAYTISVNEERLRQEVQTLRGLLEKRTTNEYLPHAKKLYDWLIRPVEPELRRQAVETLVMVPAGVLRTIPTAALHDGEQFVVQRYATATTPGLTLTDPRPIGGERMQVLLNGITQPVQGFPALPSVSDELASIGHLYAGTVLQDKEFVIPNFKGQLANTSYSVVHVASHGQFDEDISKTFVLTYESRLSMDDLERLMGLTTLRDKPVELLTLSACQTAAGDDRAALGLAGLAVKAGARSAVATLWSINDPASASLMANFYQNLTQPGVSKAEALRKAQLEMLADRRYQHPGYWSPFLLIGNWL